MYARARFGHWSWFLDATSIITVSAHQYAIYVRILRNPLGQIARFTSTRRSKALITLFWTRVESRSLGALIDECTFPVLRSTSIGMSVSFQGLQRLSSYARLAGLVAQMTKIHERSGVLRCDILTRGLRFLDHVTPLAPKKLEVIARVAHTVSLGANPNSRSRLPNQLTNPTTTQIATEGTTQV
jgi:hypothetical protein